MNNYELITADEKYRRDLNRAFDIYLEAFFENKKPYFEQSDPAKERVIEDDSDDAIDENSIAFIYLKEKNEK